MRGLTKDGCEQQPHGSASSGSPDAAAPSEPGAGSRTGADQGRPSPRGQLARFSLLYESRDGSFCLFEDELGHLHAVDARRLV